jgi:hypothetical protein
LVVVGRCCYVSVVRVGLPDGFGGRRRWFLCCSVVVGSCSCYYDSGGVLVGSWSCFSRLLSSDEVVTWW